MKKILFITLALVLAVAMFASCAPKAEEAPAEEAAPVEEAAPAEEEAPVEEAPVEEEVAAANELEGKKIYFVNAGPDDYYAQVFDVFEAVAAEHGATDIVHVNSEYAADKELNNVNDAIAAGADAIAVITAQAEGSVASIEAANEAGVPIFFLLGQPASTEYTAWTGDDFVKLGYNIGSYAAKTHAGDTWYTIDGQYGQTTAEAQCEGWLKAWQEAEPDKYGTSDEVDPADPANWQKYSLGSGNWAADPAYKITMDLIASGKEFDGLFVGNEEMMRGVAQALEENGFAAGDKWCVAVNGKEEAIGWIRDGYYLEATTPNPPPLQADIAVQQMCEYFTTGAVASKNVPVVPQIDVVTADNADNPAIVPWGNGAKAYLEGKAAGNYETSIEYYAQAAIDAGIMTNFAD